MAYTLGNTYAKNLCKRTVLLRLTIENVVTRFFFGTQCSMFVTLLFGAVESVTELQGLRNCRDVIICYYR